MPASHGANTEMLTGWNNMDKIKRFGDYPVGTLLEVPVSYTKTVVCRVEYVKTDYGTCEGCALNELNRLNGSGACMMFDCITNGGKHKILKKVKQ